MEAIKKSSETGRKREAQLSQANTKIKIALSDLAPDLLISLGERGYRDWGARLEEELRNGLSAGDQEDLAFTIQKPTSKESSRKGAELLAISSIAIGLSGVGYFIDAEKTTKVLDAIWTVLKKLLPRNSKVAVTYERTVSDRKTVTEKFTLDTAAHNPETTHSLLKAGHALLESLQSKSQTAGRVAVTFTPEKP